MKVYAKFVNVLKENVPLVKSEEAKRITKIANRLSSAQKARQKPGQVKIIKLM